MKKQIYFCVDLRTRMQDSDIQVGEARKGCLVMTHDHERFEFDEELPKRDVRNTKVWKGTLFNVIRDKQGKLQLHFRRIELTKGLDSRAVCALFLADLLNAKKAMEL